MIYYLRDKNGKNYFETDNYIDNGCYDVHPHIYCTNYINKTLDLQSNNLDYLKWIKWMSFFDEFRGWFWEEWVQHNCKKGIITDINKADLAVKNKLQEIASDLDLYIITD